MSKVGADGRVSHQDRTWVIGIARTEPGCRERASYRKKHGAENHCLRMGVLVKIGPMQDAT